MSICRLDENELRKVQAAIIIAKTLHYHPEIRETPRQIIDHSLEGLDYSKLTDEELTTIKEMIALAESIGI